MSKIIVFCLFIYAFAPLAMESDLIRSQIRVDEVSFVSSKKNNDPMFTGGFNELISFINPSIDQEDAGSCLYMSHTAVVEWWLNFLEGNSNEMIDLSERYYMALKTEDIGAREIKNWRTDNIYRVNVQDKFVSQKSYPFIKGHFTTHPITGERIASDATAKGAIYNTEFNWISFKNEIDSQNQDNFIQLPKFKRELIHVDKNDDQWSVGQAPFDIVDRIKEALIKNRAPVNVIYNHHGFWHAVVIVGFNDFAPTNNCPYAAGFAPFMNEKALEQEFEAAQTTDQSLAKKLISKAKLNRSKAQQVQNKLSQIGGCSKTGVFYVRDSINPDPLMPLYDYDKNRTGEEAHMNAPIIFREYEWMETTGNHAYQILLDQSSSNEVTNL